MKRTAAMNTRELGKIGEDAAVAFLSEKDYRIIERNFRIGRLGEIDIVAEKIDRKWLILGKKTLVLIEVKALEIGSDKPKFIPEEHMTPEKIRRLVRLGIAYLSQKSIKLDSPWQIDAVAVEIDGYSGIVRAIRHHENIPVFQ